MPNTLSHTHARARNQFRKASPASATIFWNLILWLHFSYALPVAFLLQESVDRLQAQAAAASSSAAAPSH